MKNILYDSISKQEALDFIKEFLKKELELLSRKEINEETFKDSNWALYQAYLAGMKKGLVKVSELLPDQGKKDK